MLQYVSGDSWDGPAGRTLGHRTPGIFDESLDRDQVELAHASCMPQRLQHSSKPSRDDLAMASRASYSLGATTSTAHDRLR